MLIRSIVVAALAVVMAAGFAQAKCDVECRQNEAYLGGVWKNRQAVDIGEETYYVAIVPDKKSALVYWTDGIKMTSQTTVQTAADEVSRCRSDGTSVFSRYSDDPNTPVKTRKFRKKNFLQVSLKC